MLRIHKMIWSQDNPQVVRRFFFPFTAICSGSAANAEAATTYHYNNFRTGCDSHETVLTPATVCNLQLATTVPLDEQVDAQPLLVPGASPPDA